MRALKMNMEEHAAVETGNLDFAKGPSYFEVAYLKQLKDELEIFLRSKNFSTIQKFEIAFEGNDYMGHMRIGA